MYRRVIKFKKVPKNGQKRQKKIAKSAISKVEKPLSNVKKLFPTVRTVSFGPIRDR